MTRMMVELTFAVDVVVRAFASVGRVQVLATILALVALLVPSLERQVWLVRTL